MLGLPGDTSTYIPCWFRHNSVVSEGWIRRVHEATPTSPKRAQPEPTSPNGVQVASASAQAASASSQVAKSGPAEMQVRAVTAKLGKVLERLVKNATSFVQLVEGVWGIQLETDTFVNVHEALPNETLPLRTTLAFINGQWKLLGT